MRCPFCTHDDTQVKDSRPTEDSAAIRRRRFCPACSSRFTTFERVQLRDLIVLKKDGQRVPFDRDKLGRSIRIACRKRKIDDERMESVVNDIQRLLEGGGESEIPSSRIGEMVMDALKSLDQVAYVRYASVYWNFDEARDFEQFVETLSGLGIVPMAADDAAAFMTADDGDAAFMTAALRLAERGLGNVWPNPAVGCVLVKDGVVVGRGWTQPGGRPHAESEALARAGAAARGATAYVTLEPCCHWGRTPPCAESLIDAGIARAVVAVEDPDPRVSGCGLARLRAAGVETTLGLAADEARRLNAGFFSVLERRQPLLAVKIATSLDGRIATAGGESRWITGENSRRFVHALRHRFDAVLVGSGTVLADDPDLTCRLSGPVLRQKIRIVADGRLRLPLHSRLARSAQESPVWLVTAPGHDKAKLRPYRDAGVEVLEISRTADGALDSGAMLCAFAERGLTRVLAEGGGVLAASLFKSGLADRVIWFRAPLLLGGDARPAVADLGVESLELAPRFKRRSQESFGGDSVETFERE